MSAGQGRSIGHDETVAHTRFGDEQFGFAGVRLGQGSPTRLTREFRRLNRRPWRRWANQIYGNVSRKNCMALLADTGKTIWLLVPRFAGALVSVTQCVLVEPSEPAA